MGTDAERTFTALGRDRYFEDYVAGETHVLGEVRVEEREMLDFAHAFDPQDIHIDPAKAAAGQFGGIIASGWYTGGLMMRLYARHYLSAVSSLASPGMDGLSWLAPVRAGDVLCVRAAIRQTRRSKSKPDRGIVKTFVEVLNQDQTVVMTLNAVNLIALRNPEQAE